MRPVTELVTAESPDSLFLYGSSLDAGEVEDAYGYHDASRRWLDAAVQGLWHIVDMITLAARKEYLGAEDYHVTKGDPDRVSDGEDEAEESKPAGTLLQMFGKVKGNRFVKGAMRRIKDKIDQANLDLASENATNRHIGDIDAYLRAVDKYIDALDKSRFVPCEVALQAIRAGCYGILVQLIPEGER